MSESRLVPIIIPSLVSILLRSEKNTGSPLTEQEVLDIRDKAPAVALPPETAAYLAETRGYHDIDAENCWEEWQRVRLDLIEADPEIES